MDRWLAHLERNDLVVTYDPDTVDGFALVPRRPDIDVGIVRG